MHCRHDAALPFEAGRLIANRFAERSSSP